MKKPIVSFVMPGIRRHNWARVYDSLKTSTTQPFELIIVSPLAMLPDLERIANVKYIRDFGSPTRCQQLGSIIAEGKYIFAVCDDAVFIPGAVDANLVQVEAMGPEISNVLTCKYSESAGFSHKDRFQPDDYYRMINSYPVDKAVTPADWWVFNASFVRREYFEYLGGYDCVFGVTAMAHNDFGMRALLNGTRIVLSQTPIYWADHSQPDHMPIEVSQLQFDAPLFEKRYHQPYNTIQLRIPLDNWKNADALWPFRFREENYRIV